MSEQLVNPTTPSEPGTAGADHEADVLSAGRRPVWLRAVGIVGAGAVLGVVAAFVWEWVWTPPTGAAYRGRWLADADGLPMLADATALFVLVTLGAGVLYGVGVVLLVRGRELQTLAAVAVGSVALAFVAAWVGPMLGPPDAGEVAAGLGDLEPVTGSLELLGAWDFRFPWVVGTSALLAPVVGALAVLVVVWLGARPASSRTDNS